LLLPDVPKKLMPPFLFNDCKMDDIGTKKRAVVTKHFSLNAFE